MENQELLTQIATLFNQQTEVMTEYLDSRVAEAERRIAIKIETDITKRIDALFDGYKMAHEKQVDQQRQLEAMLTDMELIKLRVLALENKGA